MTDSPTVGIVVPAYRPDIEILTAYLDRLDDIIDPATLRVELDAPTESLCERLAETPATVAVSSQRRGKGAAITAGFEALDTDVLAFADADGATPAPELDRIIDAVTAPDVDLAAGSRRHPDASVETEQSRSRAVMGDGFAWLARRLLDVSLYDYQCGAKALTADAWEQVRGYLTESGFAWDIELLAFAGMCDLCVREIPIAWHDHPDSTVPPIRTAVKLGSALLHTRYRTTRHESGLLSRGLATFSDGRATLLEDHPSKRNE